MTGTLLAVAVGLLLVKVPPKPYFVPNGPISALLPKSLAGWNAQDQPLGPTEFSSQAALQTLGLDDYVYRIYRREGQEIAVYVAYWRPGNSLADEVYRHTPDQCWPAAGMKRLESASGIERPFPECRLQPGEYRRFSSLGGDIFVWFWRIEGGRSSPVLLTDAPTTFSDLARRVWVKLRTALILGRKESVLVRISSNLRPADAARESLFARIAESLAATGLVVEKL